MRQNRWTTIEKNNEFLKSYIGDYNIAYVRILTKTINNDDFVQYFQVSFTDVENKKNFKSFKIYNDDEEIAIKNNLHGIETQYSSF